MARNKVAKARVDALLQRGPLENGQPPWFSPTHNRYLEDQLGFARGSMMGFFQSQNTIAAAAREALDSLVETRFGYTRNEHERERLERLAEETAPPYTQYAGGLRRRPAVLKSETRTRRRNMPPSVALNDFGEDEWGADVTVRLDALTPESIPAGNGLQSGLSTSNIRSETEEEENEEMMQLASLARSWVDADAMSNEAQSAVGQGIRRRPGGSGPEKVHDGRVQRQPQQRSPTKQQRSPTKQNATVRRSSRLRTSMDRGNARGSK